MTSEYQRVHQLSVPGLQIENLVVKVLDNPTPVVSAASGESKAPRFQNGSGGGAKTKKAPASQRDRAFSTVLVGDESGTITLVFRSQDKKSEVRRGRFILVCGTVTTFRGRVQLKVGPRPTDLQALKHGVSMSSRPHLTLPPTAAAVAAVSTVVHHAGVVLVRPVRCPTGEDGAPYAIHYGVQHHQREEEGGRVLYVDSVLPHMHETFAEAASRSLLQVLGHGDGMEGVLLANLPAITEFHVDDQGKPHIYHFFLATASTSGECQEEEEEEEEEEDGESPGSTDTSLAEESSTSSKLLERFEDEGDDQEVSEERQSGMVWVTRTSVRELRKTEEGKHLYPIIRKAHALLEEAVKNGIMVGPAWSALRDYLMEPVIVPDDQMSHQAGNTELWSFLADPENHRGEGAPLPVTLLSGFLGSGKTTLMRHLLQNQAGWRVAILVNDMNELNLDSEMIVSDSKIKIDRMEERVVSLSNGCICCTLREDLLAQIVSLARSGERFDYMLIESSGISEPMPVAETFTFEDEEGRSLSTLARLDTCVTVVDAFAFMDNLSSIQKVADKATTTQEEAACTTQGQHTAQSSEPDEDKTVADLMAEQVEFADVIILNKTDRVDSSALPTLEALVRRLNPAAKVISTSYARVAPQEVINTGLFSMDKARQAPGWLRELRGEHVPETIEYGVTSILYRRHRPFHPERLHALVYGAGDGTTTLLKSLVRVKGYVWLAGREKYIVFWSLAGSLHSFDCQGDRWLAASDPSQWPEGVDMQELTKRWQPLWGDRRQEVVLIGVHMDSKAIEDALDGCLLTEEEMATMAPWQWAQSFKDPFPAYNSKRHGHGDDHHQHDHHGHGDDHYDSSSSDEDDDEHGVDSDDEESSEDEDN